MEFALIFMIGITSYIIVKFLREIDEMLNKINKKISVIESILRNKKTKNEEEKESE